MSKYATVKILRALADDMDTLMEDIGYWPSRGAFVREACIEKMERVRKMEHEKESRATYA